MEYETLIHPSLEFVLHHQLFVVIVFPDMFSVNFMLLKLLFCFPFTISNRTMNILKWQICGSKFEFWDLIRGADGLPLVRLPCK